MNTEQRAGSIAATHGYRADIDGLRAVAVLAVVVYHAYPLGLPGGFIGVDVFFVISGFLISSIILKGLASSSFNILDFYSRRVRRIFPALTVVLAMCCLYGWFYLTPQDYAALGKHVAGGASFISNFMLLAETGYFDTKAELKPLLHLWSLAIEEQYYLIWPITLWLFWRWRAGALVPIVLMGAASFMCNVALSDGLSANSFYLPFTRFWELLVGSGLAATSFRASRTDVSDSTAHIPAASLARRRLKSDGCALLGLVLLAAGLVLISKESRFPGWWALLPTAGAALLISGGRDSLVNRCMLASPVLVWIGLISYPLYLWHWPLLSFARIHYTGPLPHYVVGALVATSFVLAWATYFFIERPLRFGGHGVLKTLGLVVVLVTVGLVGFLIHAKDGYPSRYPAIIRYAVQDIDFLWNQHVRTEKCHLERKYFYEHQPECFEERRPLIALWGDSHAAALYPGLRTLQETREFGIIQVSSANCPPIFKLELLTSYPLCNDMNQAVFSKLIERKPDILVLHAAWQLPDYPLSISELRQKVEDTLRVIKEKMPSTRVIVLGPTPRWNGSPQAEIYRSWLAAQDRHAEPPIMQKAELLAEVEEALRASCEATGVQYLSITAEVCKDGLCVSRVGPNPTDMFARDGAHLTKAGSDYLWRRIEAKFFTEPPR